MNFSDEPISIAAPSVLGEPQILWGQADGRSTPGVPQTNNAAAPRLAPATNSSAAANDAAPTQELITAADLKHYWRSDHYGELSKGVLSRPAIVVAIARP